MNIIQKIIKALDDYLNANENLTIDTQREEIKQLKKVLEEREKEQELQKEVISILQLEAIDTQAKLNELENELADKETDLDKYCKKHFKKIAPIAYKQKRSIQGKKYSISLQELVTPNSYEVIQLFKGKIKGTTLLGIAKSIGKVVGARITWTDDKNLDSSGDYYLYPNETIANRKGDCEDHAFVCMSAHPEIGGAWGFYTTFGHAYNVFVYDDELYVLDSSINGYSYTVGRLKDLPNYKINYIVTRSACYQVDGSVNFGALAGW